MKYPLLALLALSACAAQVSHPTKTTAQMRVDIDRCTDQANHKYWMDPIAALYNAYDCLEADGYRRGRSGFAAQVEKSMGEKAARVPKPVVPPQPCVVPCKR